MKKYVFVVFSLLLFSCCESVMPEITDDPDHLAVVVSNQSFLLPKIDIKVYIDGKQIISDDFDVGTQHNYKIYKVKVKNGPHIIKAKTLKGECVAEAVINYPEYKRCTVLYFYYKRPDNFYNVNQCTFYPSQFRIDVSKYREFYYGSMGG